MENLEHLRHVPFYRITTPKLPIYTMEEIRKGSASSAASRRRKQDEIEDDVYLIPPENYNSMKIELYSELIP
jgi:hypothetical protein